MKKKIITLLIIIFMLIGICNRHYALETAIVYVESNKNTVEIGEEIEITLNLKNNKTAAFDFFLYYDNTKWEYLSTIDNTNVKDNYIIYVWHDKEGGKSSKQGELIKFKFRAKKEGTSTFNVNGNFYNSLGQQIQTSFEEKQVQIGKTLSNQKNSGNLQTLRLNIEGITPEFNANTYEYYITVANTVKNIEVLALSEDTNAIVNITGNTNLKEGLNIIKIQVIPENKKEEKIYTINVTKTEDLSLANANLEILAIENVLLNPPFETSVLQYKTEVSLQTSDLNIIAIPENEKAKVQIMGATNLKEGDNIVNILVTAANGFSTKKYQVKVHRRNEGEQKVYQNEKDEQNEKLEEAYEIDKLTDAKDNQIENSEKEEAKKKKNNNMIIGIAMLVISTFTISVITFFILKNKKKNKV